MYYGFAYVSDHGILKKEDYAFFTPYIQTMNCRVEDEELAQRNHIKDIGYLDHEGNTNEKLRELLQKQPISIGMHTTGNLMQYSDGILTEKYLKCSSPDLGINHGVLLVGYGSTADSSGESDLGMGAKCENYWIIRNSWGSSWGQDGFFKLCADGLGDTDTP